MNAGSARVARSDVMGALFYMAYFAATGAAYPYYNLYYQSVGMTNQQIGLLSALPTLVTVISGPFWAGLADRLNLHRVLLPGLLLATVLPAALIPGAVSFWALAALVLAFYFFLSPAIPLADNSILTMLGDRRDRYGKLRLWGAVGFGLSSWVLGFITASQGMPVIWLAFIIMMLPTVLIAARLPHPTLTVGTPYLSALRQLAGNRRWWGFMGAIFLVGTGYAMYDTFYTIHLKAIGASQSLFGLLFMVATISELPIFFFSTQIIKKLSLRGMVLLALAMFVVRGFAWSLVVDPAWGVAVQLLHGVSFSALWTAGVLYVNRITPEGLGASAQALFGTMIFGLSRAVGALVGAQVFDTLGGTAMFRIAAGVALVGVIAFLVTERRADRLEAAAQPAGD